MKLFDEVAAVENGPHSLPFFLPILHVQILGLELRRKKKDKIFSWWVVSVEALNLFLDGILLFLHTSSAEILGIVVLLLLHALNKELDFGFGFVLDNHDCDSSEDPDSDPCAAFLVPAFD